MFPTREQWITDLDHQLQLIAKVIANLGTKYDECASKQETEAGWIEKKLDYEKSVTK